MRVMVTGNLGYIGSAMVTMMLSEGYDVLGYDSDLYQRCSFGYEPEYVPTILKDIRDAEIEDFEDIDAVCHLAGLSNDPLGDLNPKLTLAINYHASVRLAELAKKAGVRRFVFSSSCSNYGAGGDLFLNEESEFHPVTVYGESKVLAEREISRMADDKFSPTFLRNATAYGESPRIRFDLVLNNLVAWAFTTGKIRMKSDGNAWRPIVHVEDISRAFMAVLSAKRHVVHNQAYNVGITSENFRIRDLAHLIGDIMTDCKISFADDAEADSRCYRVNCDKICRELDYHSKWSARRGVCQLYNAYHNFGLSLADFEGARYKRVAHIKMLIEHGILNSDLRYSNMMAEALL